MIFDIQRNSFVDGPGIRTTVFFKGCNLRCAWCHNPEGQSPTPQEMKEKTAERTCGKDYTTEALLSEICKDRLFYEASGGGVTFSGGECMLQIEFLEEILMQCKKNGIHTAVDTAGHVPYESFERILPYTDLFLYDVKCLDSEKHRQYTGVGNELILGNLKRLLSTDQPVWVRIPVIPTVNDTREEMLAIRDLLDSYGMPQMVELLPFHELGAHKYEAIGQEPPHFPLPSDAEMKALTHLFERKEK